MSTTTMPLTEKDIQRGIRDCLGSLGFVCYHNAYAIGSDSGFPDLVCVSDDGLLAAVECKGPKGSIRAGQAEWIERFSRIPGCVFAEIVGPDLTRHWMAYDSAVELIQQWVEKRRNMREYSRKRRATGGQDG